jgi:signal transduction histidine kinase
VLLSIKPINDVRVVDGTESFPTFQVDANKIERVFTNLIKNAAEAMPNGGTINIGSRQNGVNIEFTFQDTGIGMSPEVMSKLFTPLYTTKTTGTGLGLAICKRIVEAHEGKISFESATNKGTTFTVTLPMKQKTRNQKDAKTGKEI